MDWAHAQDAVVYNITDAYLLSVHVAIFSSSSYTKLLLSYTNYANYAASILQQLAPQCISYLHCVGLFFSNGLVKWYVPSSADRYPASRGNYLL